MSRHSFLAPLFGAVLVAVCASGCSADDDVDSSSDDVTAAPLKPTKNYADRVKILALLKKAHPIPEEFGDPRDGIRALTEWQQRSGRAEMERDARGSLTGWWSIANYHIVVASMLALQKRGEFPTVKVEIADGDEWTVTPEEETSANAFYAVVDESRDKMRRGASGAERDQLEKKVRFALWAVHDVCLAVGKEKARVAFGRMTKGEREFGESFADAFEPIMSGLGAPPHTLEEIVPVYFPARVIKGDDLSSDLSGANLPQKTFMLSLKAVNRIELELPVVKHPVRNAARRFGSRLVPRQVDPVFDRFIGLMTTGELKVEKLLALFN